MKLILRALFAFLAAGALLLALTSPGQAADVFPSQDACHVTSNASPSGSCGAFKLLYRETFNNQTVPVGTFRGCAGDGNFYCSGTAGTRYTQMGAYPEGWTDTAGHHGDGNSGPVPGVYRPDLTTSVIRTSTGDGQMKVHMYRPSSGGSNRVAAMVPRKCMNLRYGKFTERTRISARTKGFKMAHLRYTPNEIDYPEAGGTFATDPVSLFDHGFDEGSADVASNSAWTGWHTYSLELTPGHVRAYYDGRLKFSRAADYPDRADWILQNESALGDVAGAAPGSSVDILTSWITCYSYAP